MNEKMRKETREFVALHYTEGWSVRQIAEAMVSRNWYRDYRQAVRVVDEIVAEEWERAVKVTLP